MCTIFHYISLIHKLEMQNLETLYRYGEDDYRTLEIFRTNDRKLSKLYEWVMSHREGLTRLNEDLAQRNPGRR